MKLSRLVMRKSRLGTKRSGDGEPVVEPLFLTSEPAILLLTVLGLRRSTNELRVFRRSPGNGKAPLAGLGGANGVKTSGVSRFGKCVSHINRSKGFAALGSSPPGTSLDSSTGRLSERPSGLSKCNRS